MKSKSLCRVLVISSLCGLSLPASSWSASIDMGNGTRIDVPLKSLKDLRDQNVVKQGFDYSCGAAAMATLLTYGIGDPTTEAEVLSSVMKTLSKDQEALRKKEGLSLLDLQQMAQAKGHKALGFRLTPEYLGKLSGPVIVFIKPHGYEHFAVLKGLRGDRIYLADPSLGNTRMPLYQFLEMWLDEQGKGVIFIIERQDGNLLETTLKPPATGLPQPEILSARQMLEIGNPYARFPNLTR